MRELALLLFLIAAASTPRANAEEACRATGESHGEVAVCGDTSELDAKSLQAAADAAAPPGRSNASHPLATDIPAAGSRPTGPSDRENVPKGRRY
jgi:hypothetical protein